MESNIGCQEHRAPDILLWAQHMSTDAALEQVIDRTALIENILNQVIEAHLGPRNEGRQFLRDILLDSSILPLGSKVKVAMAIAQQLSVKLDQYALHSVVSLRNAFAHHAANAHPVLKVGNTPDTDQLHYTLQVISNSGRLTRNRREDALSEFSASYAKAKESLLLLLDALRASHAANNDT